MKERDKGRLGEFEPYDGEVLRVFSTAHPSQDLLDDLLDDAAIQSLMNAHYYEGGSCDKSPVLRVLERSHAEILQQEISSKFKPENWYASRYSDGTWGVLYAAETEKTALRESLYHKRRFYEEELKSKAISIDLRIAKLKLSSESCLDLLAAENFNPEKLTSQDESGYPYCQKIAERYLRREVQMFRAPSARDAGGVCTPIFSEDAVQKDRGHLRFVKCILKDDGVEIFRKLSLV